MVVMMMAAHFHPMMHAVMHAFAHSFFHQGHVFSYCEGRNCDCGQRRQNVKNYLTTMKRRPAPWTLRAWTISALQEAGAIRECEEHGWMRDRADPHARDNVLDIARQVRNAHPERLRS
jgi:hypothetical protein